ncbi:gluconokinase [Marivivens donghaensis]|uniref:Gluconokinase n=1 Tax=Marivivens donghaensis TaxID=1699413 RepID=A0ABX0VZI0_9RHOB|nr:gluconokinase [Marivivens donghaensis]NIY73234.1 gluconokinase [Marivivens donghaensis]
MKPAYVVMGVSGSGKSTVGRELAAHLGAVFIDADDLHPEENVAHMAAGHPLNDEMRWPWLDKCGQEMASHREEGPVVLACSALKRVYRDRLRKWVPDLVIVYPAADAVVIAERMSHRANHFMPVSLLQSQFATLEEPSSDEDVIRVNAEGTVEQTVKAVINAI